MRALTVSRVAELEDALASAERAAPALRYLHRLYAVLLVARGQSCYQVARWLGRSPRSVELWVRRFEARGAAGLADQRKMAGSRRLKTPQLEQLLRDVSSSPRALGYDADRWRAPLLRHLIETRYAVSLSERHCRRLLGALHAAALGAAVPSAPRTALPARGAEVRGAGSRELAAVRKSG